jgi:hypothetical protein
MRGERERERDSVGGWPFATVVASIPRREGRRRREGSKGSSRAQRSDLSPSLLAPHSSLPHSQPPAHPSTLPTVSPACQAAGPARGCPSGSCVRLLTVGGVIARRRGERKKRRWSVRRLSHIPCRSLAPSASAIRCPALWRRDKVFVRWHSWAALVSSWGRWRRAGHAERSRAWNSNREQVVACHRVSEQRHSALLPLVPTSVRLSPACPRYS